MFWPFKTIIKFVDGNGGEQRLCLARQERAVAIGHDREIPAIAVDADLAHLHGRHVGVGCCHQAVALGM